MGLFFAKNNIIYSGRYPDSGREIAISGVLAKNMGKKVGDTVTLEYGKVKVDCTIVGLSQALGGNMITYITKEISRECVGEDAYNNYSLNKRNIYLKEGVDRGAFIKKVNAILDATELSYDTYDNIELIQSKVFDIVGPATTLLLSIIMGVTVIVIIAVIFMIIRMKMFRERKSMAINKALGFTSLGIMNQIGLSTLLIAIPATLLGGILGGLLSGPIISLVGGFMGLMKIKFLVQYGYIFLICLALIIVTYLITLAVAFSTRRISPRMLVADAG